MRVAIAGLGAATVRGHLPALRLLECEGRVKLVAGADPSASRRSAVAAAIPGVPIFARTREMLAKASSDVLVIATEPRAHAALVRLAVDHQQQVLCEKPLVLTSGEFADIAACYAGRSNVGLASVHQYRYSPPWVRLEAAARLLDRMGVRFELSVEVERPGTDPHAAAPWRADLGSSGGMLADHGVHFLALAWTIRQELRVLAGLRTATDDGEHSTARVSFGHGVLDLSLWSGGRRRLTCVGLESPQLRLCWRDATVDQFARGRSIGHERVAALSDRRHVDSLYVPLYRELAARGHDPSWWALRTAEALGVARALVAVLELAARPARAA